MTDSKLPKQNQSKSAIKRQARLDNANQRSFGGKLENFADNRERHFHQRMLKAYIRGNKIFPFGFETVRNIRTGQFDPIYHDVLLTDKYVDAKKIDALLAGGYCDPGKVFGGASKNKSEIRKAIKKRIKDKKKKQSLIFGSKKDIDGFKKQK